MRTETASAERVIEVERLVASAEQEARTEQERILSEATAEQDRIRSEASAQSDEVVTRAKEEGRALLEQVQEARRRVLADLATRRRALSMQIEQLRAARDEMAASVHGVRDKVDGILDRLDRSEDQARAAALAVGDHIRLHGQDEASGEPGGADHGGGDGGGGRGRHRRGRRRRRTRAATAQCALGRRALRPDPRRVRHRPAGDRATGAPSTDPDRGDHGEVGRRGRRSGGRARGSRSARGGARRGDGGARPVPTPRSSPGATSCFTPIAAKLNRTVKRTLGDDQNRMLDLLRSTPSIDAEGLLGPEDAHLALFADAVQDQLGEAYAAGATFAGNAAAGMPRGDAVDQAATGLARAVVAMLRRRIADGSEEPGARVGAAFREWRGQRVERLAGDAATHAFSAGVAAAAAHGSDGKVRWVVTSTGGCSDCEDNALAGASGLVRGVPHRARLPAGALGLPLPRGTGGRAEQEFSATYPGPGRFGRVGGR